MSKKSFKDTGADLFISSREDTQDTRDTLGTSNTKHERINLKLDAGLKNYLNEAAWQKRTSVTKYINDLIRADRENRTYL